LFKTNNRRLLYLAPSLGLTLDQSGGAGTHMRGTILGFQENGFDVLPIIGGDVIKNTRTLNITPTSNSKTSKQNVLRERIKSFIPRRLRLFLRDLRTIWQERKLQRLTYNQIFDYKPDFIYERSGYLLSYGNRLSKKLKVPHFIETDGCMVEIISKDYGVFSEYIGNWIEKRKLKNADFVVTMSKMGASQVARKFSLRAENILVKTLGVEFSNFKYDEASFAQLLEKYSTKNKFVVGFAGAISTYHGVKYLIEAASFLHKKNCSEIILMIVGWSKEGERLKKIVEEKNLDNVIFTGRVNKKDIPNYYKLFTVGVIPNAEENLYPIKVLEYGVFKLCPIVPDYPVFKDIIVEGETGYYFQPQNSLSLSQIILNLFNNQEGCNQAGQRWHAHVKEYFEWKNTVRPIIDALSK